MNKQVRILPGTPDDANREYLPERIKTTDIVVNENGKKTMSVIYLKNGELVLTPVSVDTLNQRMEKE